MKKPNWLKKSLFNNKKYLKRKRFYIQILFLVLLNFSFAFTGFIALRWLCLPVINCWACPWAVFGCPVGAMANLAALHVFAFGVLGVIATTAVLLGRWTCGWVCPFGWIQELLYMIPTPKFDIPAFLRYFKYVALVFMVFAIPYMFGGGTVQLSDLRPVQEAIVNEQPPDEIGELEQPVSGDVAPGSKDNSWEQFASKKMFFCYYCPAGTMEATIPMKYSPASFQVRLDNDRRKRIIEAGKNPDEVKDDDTEFPRLLVESSSFTIALDKMVILCIFLLLFVLVKRPFCRVACPMGASLGMLSRVSLLRLKVDHDKCINCDACARRCPQGIAIYKDDCPTAECIQCNECVVICPTKAISYENPFKLGKKLPQMPSEDIPAK